MDKSVQAGAPSWAPVPPTSEMPYLKILWPRIGRPIAGWMLADRPEGAWCHWLPDQSPGAKPTAGRTTCCVGRENGCRYCCPSYGRKWQAFMPYLCSVEGRIYLAQITTEAARTCPPLSDPRRHLRGSFLRLERLGAKANGRVQAEIVVAAAPPLLPRSPDVRKVLEKIWGVVPVMVPLSELMKGDHDA